MALPLSYKDAIDRVLLMEGGFVNDPDDSGGATNYGITRTVYEKFKGRTVSISEMKNMPKSDAVTIYKRKYWDKIGGDDLHSYAIAYALFDQAVNRGVAASIKTAQRILKLKDDGIMGPVTIEALNQVSANKFIAQFLTDSIKAYQDIVLARPKDKKFLKGWLNRIAHIESYVSKVAKA